MTLHVRHRCPQCAGEIELEESDRVLTCSYCGVAHLLLARGYLRLGLPVRTKLVAAAATWVPYLHFKGSAFWLRDTEVTQTVLHVSAPGVSCADVPPSLGFRSQTQRLQVIDSAPAGAMARFDRKPADLLRAALPAAAASSPAPAYIGEAISIIYLPLIEGPQGWIDGVSGRALTAAPALASSLLEAPQASDVLFVPAMCPRCGADLAGDPHAIAFPCVNCEAAWEAEGSGLAERQCESAVGHGAAGVHLPFWRFEVDAGGPVTMAEAAAATGQPLLRRQPPDARWQFWCPAFKILPRTLLRLCERLSLGAFTPALRAGVPGARRHPVTLPSREAGEMLPVALSALAFDVRARPHLFVLRPRMAPASLVYLAFERRGTEFVHAAAQVSVSCAALSFGDAL